MKLHALQSDKGDCLLLETNDAKHRMLIDGGIGRAYKEHVAPFLGKLRAANKDLDIVYVSHIDDDHIAGVLQLLEDEAAWRVHEHHKNNGSPDHPEPERDRPPVVKAIFHNAFHDVLGKNSGDIETMLAAKASILSGNDHPRVRESVEHHRDLATSIPQGLRVSKRIGKRQLNIPLNPHFGGKLMLVKKNAPTITRGSITLRILGPFPKDLTKLRTEWDKWLRENQDKARAIRAEARTNEQDLGASVESLMRPMLHEAQALGAAELRALAALGDRGEVTTPNLASLMFLAEEAGQTLLLTGDGHSDEILAGLEHHQALDANGRLHVNVLKVQHHGSENNINKDFCDRITADRYVFCGNGQHENPDLRVLQLLFDRRIANDKKTFTFCFNSTSTVSTNAGGRAHLRKIERLLKKLQDQSPRLRTKFITGSALRVL